MMANVKNFFIKLMAITVIFLCFYPVVLVLRTFIYKDSTIWSEFIFGAAVVYLGFILAHIFINDKKSFLRSLITYLLVIVPVIVSILMYISHGKLRPIFEVLVTLLIYYTGVKAHFTDVDEILSTKTIGTGIVSLTICLLISQFDQRYVSLFTPVSIFAYISMILAFLVRNQQNLNRTFKLKHIDSESVPQNIRKYNIGIVIVIFFTILMLFNMKNIIIFVFRICGYVLIGVLWLFNFLLSLFIGSEGGGSGGGGQSDIIGELGGESSLLAQIIYTIIFGSLLLIVAIYVVRIIAKNFPEFVQKVKKLISRFFKWIAGLFNMSPKKDEGSEDYTDHIETIIPKEEEPIKTNYYKKISSIKRGLRILKRTDDPVKKIRIVYYLMLKVLYDKNIPIRESDTTWEIYEKAIDIEGIESEFSDITKIYNEIRYNETVPDKEEVEDTVRKFSKIYEMLK